VGVVTTSRARSHDPAVTAPAALVWIDAREAVIVRVVDDAPTIERISSDVPPHHRSTGHIRHEPGTRHGGGHEATAGEPRRLEHLESFCKHVAERIPVTSDVVVIGPGTVRHHLERRVRAAGGALATRRITGLPAGRMTDRQLVAWLRRYMEDEPRRSTVGAYRWSGEPDLEASGHPVFTPRRTFEKPMREEEVDRG
jgi:hypothetical protein